MIARILTLLLLISMASIAEGQAVRLTSEILDASATDMFHHTYDLADGWRYRSGDNPDWSRPGLDDSEWESIQLGFGNGVPRWAGIGWFRLKID